MRWHPESIYDFPTAILAGLSESAFGWQQEGFIRSGREPVTIFFSCKEPKPPYAQELMRELHVRTGIPHRSHLQDSIPVSVVDQIENADVVVTFYDHAEPNAASDDEGLYYDLMIPGCPEMGGWFCDDDHVA